MSVSLSASADLWSGVPWCLGRIRLRRPTQRSAQPPWRLLEDRLIDPSNSWIIEKSTINQESNRVKINRVRCILWNCNFYKIAIYTSECPSGFPGVRHSIRAEIENQKSSVLKIVNGSSANFGTVIYLRNFSLIFPYNISTFRFRAEIFTRCWFLEIWPRNWDFRNWKFSMIHW